MLFYNAHLQRVIFIFVEEERFNLMCCLEIMRIVVGVGTGDVAFFLGGCFLGILSFFWR